MKSLSRNVLLGLALTGCHGSADYGAFDLSHAVRDVVERAQPAVVRVRSKGDMAQGEGSGFFVKVDGGNALVVTNHHVVWGAQQVEVERSDSTKTVATIVGVDRAVDIALLRCSSVPPVQPLALGDDAAVAPGDWLVSMGDAAGLPNAASVGVLSARSRVPAATLEAEKLVDYLFTDASLGPGSSGGPVLDLKGDVVGVSAAMFGSNRSLGVVIPSGIVKGVIQHLLRDGQSVHAFAGMEVEDALVRTDKSNSAVRVTRIVPHGPADQAAIQSGDEIVSMDGQAVRNAAAFRRSVFMAAPATHWELRLTRAGVPLSLTIKLGELLSAGARAEAGALVHQSTVPFTQEQF